MRSSCTDDRQRYAEAIERARSRLGSLAEPFVFLPATGSTNDVALARCAERAAPGSHGLVVVADEQTAGRGRRGRTWFSPPRAGLYVSVVLSPGSARVHPARALSLVTIAAGVALAEGVAEAARLEIDLKWPNDLYVGGRKLAGVLAERASDALVVVGYGINIAPSAFPPELRDRATSIESEGAGAIDRAHVLVETLAALARRYDDLLDGRFDAILDAWRARAPGAEGARVSWSTNAGAMSGVTAGIDDDGALLVRADDGATYRIVGGEVIWTP